MNFCSNARIQVYSDLFQNIFDFYRLRNQNTNSIFVPLNGTQSELPGTIYIICLSIFVVKFIHISMV